MKKCPRNESFADGSVGKTDRERRMSTSKME